MGMPSVPGGGGGWLLPHLRCHVRTRWDTQFWMSCATSSKLGKWTSTSTPISLPDALPVDIIFGGGGGGGSGGGGGGNVI